MGENSLKTSNMVWKIFQAIYIYEGISFQELMDFSGKAKSTISDLLKPLLKKKFIRLEKKDRKNVYFTNLKNMGFSPTIAQEDIGRLIIMSSNYEQFKIMLNREPMSWFIINEKTDAFDKKEIIKDLFKI